MDIENLKESLIKLESNVQKLNSEVVISKLIFKYSSRLYITDRELLEHIMEDNYLFIEQHTDEIKLSISDIHKELQFY